MAVTFMIASVHSALYYLSPRPLALPPAGWNDLQVTRPSTLLDPVGSQRVYFVHSYRCGGQAGGQARGQGAGPWCTRHPCLSQGPYVECLVQPYALHALHALHELHPQTPGTCTPCSPCSSHRAFPTLCSLTPLHFRLLSQCLTQGHFPHLQPCTVHMLPLHFPALETRPSPPCAALHQCAGPLDFPALHTGHPPPRPTRSGCCPPPTMEFLLCLQSTRAR